MREILGRLLIWLAVLGFSSSASAQSWQNFGSAQRRIVAVGDTQWRINGGSLGFLYLKSKHQADSASLPLALRGQVATSSVDNTTTYVAQDPLRYGQFVYTSPQLTRALSAGQATQLQIFKTFKRYVHGITPVTPTDGVPSNIIPGNPSQTNSFAYDTVAKRVNSTQNTGPVIGLFSPIGYDHYVHTVTLGSSQADNDNIGVVIAFFEDYADMVPNNAYHIDTTGYNWPIDVVDSLIPNQHVLAVYRQRNGASGYYISYDKLKLTETTILDGNSTPGLYNTTANWAGQTVDLRIVRAGDTITVSTSQFSDAPGGKGLLRFSKTIILTSNPLLTKFRGKTAYGYTAQSQANAYWSNIAFSGSSNKIYDLRNGQTYDYTSGGGYVLNPTENMYRDLGTRFYWRNINEHTFGYIPPTGSYDVIVAE